MIDQQPVQVRHALIARLDNLGDVLLAGPATRAVAGGADRVTFVCSPGGRAAAELLPGVDRVLVFEAPWVPLEPGPVRPEAMHAFVEAVAADRPDQALVLTSFHQSPLPLALLLKMAGVASVAGTSEDHPGSLLDVRRRPEQDDGLHEVERSLALADALGHRLAPGDDGGLRVDVPRLDTTLRPFGDHRYVVLHPGASVPARGIDADRAAATVDRLVAAGHRVVVTGAAQEADLVTRVAGPPRDQVVGIAGRLDLEGLAGLLLDAAALISGNTGPAHLAAAVGTPVVSVFAPVVPVGRWRPWGVPTRVLGDQAIACAGCRARVCPFPGQPCLDPATPAALVAAVDDLVSSSTTTSPRKDLSCPPPLD
jgi:ADP-heptose:LPS heptosyltransferase